MHTSDPRTNEAAITAIIGDAGTGKTARLRPTIVENHNRPDTLIIQSGPDRVGEEYPLNLSVQRIPEPTAAWPTQQEWTAAMPSILEQAAQAQTLVLDAQFEHEDDPLLAAVPALLTAARESGQCVYLTARTHVVPFLHKAGVASLVDAAEILAPPRLHHVRPAVDEFLNDANAPIIKAP